MFIPADHVPPSGRPAASQISPNDWKVLARYWHPVAVEGDVRAVPFKGKLLDVELVIYRVEGRVAVAQDRCPHRHIRLSAGQIVEDRLVCPFHGLEFNAAGQCTKIPSLGRETKLPPRYRLRSFRSEVRYGLLWVCLDDQSTEQIPHFQQVIDAGVERLAFNTIRDWPVAAPYQVENYLDMAHLPFVHQRTLGGIQDATVPIPKVERTKAGLRIIAQFDHVKNGESAVLEYHNTVHLPFSVFTDVTSNRDSDVAGNIGPYRMFNIAAPTSAHECRVYMVVLMDEPSGSRESGLSVYGGNEIVAEDLVVMAEMATPDYPLDEKLLIHFPVDNISNEYRKCLRGLGLGSN